MNLKSIIEKFNGIIVIGDLHSDYDSLMKSINYARNHNLFLVSLGDLVDRGPFPFETVEAIHNEVISGNAAFVIGNHDDKHYRHILGNKVKLSNDAQRTIYDVGEERFQEFSRMYVGLITHKNSGHYHYIDDFILVHGATHSELWNYPITCENTVKFRALYGEVTGKVDSEGMSERLYNWINEIPTGKWVIVGHDRKPIHNVKISYPLMIQNDIGGNVIFVDTSCGKGGVLSGVILKNVDSSYQLEKFIQFE